MHPFQSFLLQLQFQEHHLMELPPIKLQNLLILMIKPFEIFCHHKVPFDKLIEAEFNSLFF
jgi:hypothetical protein